MADDVRVFSLKEVNRLVPRLNFLVGQQMLRRHAIEAGLKALALRLRALPSDLAVAPGDPDDVAAMKRAVEASVREYEEGWTEVTAVGGVLKDARTGLVDFYGQVEGRLVWLCWKYGEDRIDHFHALDEGFGGRKPIPEAAALRSLPN